MAAHGDRVRVLRHRIALVAWTLLTCTGLDAAPSRDVTIDDFLRLESVGRAVADPEGRWIVYDRRPAYEDFPDFGLGGISPTATTGYLMRVDTAQLGTAQPLFVPEQGVNYWVCSFSPRGTRVSFFEARSGRVALGVYDLASRRITRFDAAPDIMAVHGMLPVWRNEDTIIYAAMASGEQPYRVSIRRQIGAKLGTAWEKTWQGREPSFRALTSAVQETSPALPGRLIAADVRSGEIRTLGEGDFASPVVSSDGGYLAAFKRYRWAQPDPSKPRLGNIWSRAELWLFDLVTGESRALAPELQVMDDILQWSPDGSRLAFFAWRAGEGIESGLFYVLDLKTGRISPWPHRGFDLASRMERRAGQFPERAVWVGDGLAIAARRQTDPEAPPKFTLSDTRKPFDTPADWVLLRPGASPEVLTPRAKSIWPVALGTRERHLYVIADGDVWRLDADGAPRNITHGRFGALSQPMDGWYQNYVSFPLSDENVALQGKDGYVLIDFKRATAKRMGSDGAEEVVLLGPPTTRGATLFHESLHVGSRIVVRAPGAMPYTVDRLNAYLADVPRGRWRTLAYQFKALDGQLHALTSCLHLPAGYEPGRRYPMIVEVYPGMEPGCKDGSVHRFDGPWSLQQPANSMNVPPDLLGAHGYLYLEVASPLNLEREGSAALAHVAPLALAAVDAAVAQGYADTDRVGLIGASQGDITSLWVTTRTDRFRADVSMHGWTDQLRQYSDGVPYQYFNANEFPIPVEAMRYERPDDALGIGATPWEDLEAYLRNSPLMHADRIHTPILLINSDMDGANLAQHDAMFSELYRLGRRAKYLTYWGEGHGNSSPANIRHAWESIFDWFDTYVKNAAAEPH